MSDTHRGKIVEEIIKKQGYLVKRLAEKLNISRNTLYNRFADPELSYAFILQVGCLIRHDFSTIFPEIRTQNQIIIDNPLLTLPHEEVKLIGETNKKYIQLLEEYGKLLTIFAKVANKTDSDLLKKELKEIMGKRKTGK